MKQVFSLLLLFACTAAFPADEVRYTTIFAADPGRDPVKLFRVYEEGGARAEVSSADGGLRIRAEVPEKPVSGKRAEVRLSLNREIIADAMAKIHSSGRRLTGVDFLIAGPANAGKKFLAVLNVGPNLGCSLVLQPGEERLTFIPKVAAPPFSWDNLRNILIYFRYGSAPEMTVREIRLKTAPALPDRKLELSRPRKAVEILPEGVTFTEFFRRPEGEKVSTGPRITLSWNKNDLYVRSVATFKEPPAASFTTKDDRVYQDEAFEIFFASVLDNQAYDQFCINAKGTVRDERFGFDPDAVMMRHILEHDFPHRQKIRYENNVLTFDLTFPLSAFGIVPKKNPVCEFQLAQVVDRRSHVLGLSARDRNFDPASFSLAVFNRKPFGPGEIKIASARINGSGSSAAILADVKAENVAPGKYTIDFIVSTPDFRQIDIKGGVWQIKSAEQRTFRLGGLPDINGTFVIRILLKNKRGSVLAASVDAENQKPVAYRFAAGDFQPRVKRIEKRSGTFAAGRIRKISVGPNASARTVETAELFRKYLQDYTGADAEISREGQGDVILAIDPEGAGKHKQGYRLTVTPSKVEITGCDEPGLYYGIQTFMQMVKMPMRRTAESPVFCCKILDWPDLLIRPAKLWHPRSVPGSAPVAEPTSVGYICDFVERFAAANKLNTFLLRIDKSLMFKSHPRFETHAARRYYTMEDLKRISDFCRSRFIEVIPVLPGGGHDALIDVFPEFRDPDYLSTADVEAPGYMKLYLSCVKELLDATGCRYFACGGDEWYFKRSKKRVGAPLPEKLHGKTRAQLFLDFHLKLHRFLKERGVRLIIAHDMLIPDKNGRSFDICKTLDKLPADIIVHVWSRSKNEKLFHDRGMEMWYGSTGSEVPDTTRKYYSAYFSALYLFGTELSYRYPGTYKYHSKWFVAADAAWNFNTPLDVSLESGLADGRLAGVESLFAETASKDAGEKIVPLALPRGEDVSAALHRLYPHVYPDKKGNFRMPVDKTQFGNIPMRVTATAAAVRSGGQAAVVPVNMKAAGIIFLHSAFENKSYREKRKPVLGSVKNAWQRGYPVANYRVVYKDGSTAVIPIRLGAQIYWFGCQPMAGSCTHTRFMYIGYDRSKRPVFLYQYEWVNPHPEKEIARIELAHDNPSAFQALVFAVSAREVRQRK